MKKIILIVLLALFANLFLIQMMLPKGPWVVNDKTEMSAKFFRENILNSVPESLYEGVSKITIQRAENQIKIPGNNNAYSFYIQKTRSIYILVMPAEQMRYDFSHEVGHHNYYKMAQQEQQEWTSFFNSTQQWVREYAKIGPGEDFAEHYACALTYRSCTTDPDKMEFIQKVLLNKLNWTYKPYENFYIIEAN